MGQVEGRLEDVSGVRVPGVAEALIEELGGVG